jgi:CRP-like cAMP-binding protein
MGARLSESEERLEQTLFHEVPGQLAALLLRLRCENGTDTIATTHEELADHLGVYRETVTMALNRLKKEGLVTIARKRDSDRRCRWATGESGRLNGSVTR